MLIDKNIRLPEDSSAQILSANILGDKFISIIPGTEEKILAAGDTIEFTQSSINIEGLISKFIFGLKDTNNLNTFNNSAFSDNNKSNDQNYIFNDSSTKNSIS